MSIFSTVSKFARSPQGRRAANKAMTFAKSPEGKAKIAQVRSKLAKKPPK